MTLNVAKELADLKRLTVRALTERGFSLADPLLLLTLEAETAAHKLSVALHYRSCGQSTGYSYRRSRSDFSR
jgi:hypothetical protein